MHEIVRRQYEWMAQAFMEAGDPLAAVDCATAVIRLQPECVAAYATLEEASRRVRDTETGDEDNRLRRLRNHKRRVDLGTQRDPTLQLLLGLPVLSGVGIAPRPSTDELGRSLMALKRRLVQKKDKLSDRTRERLRALLDRLDQPQQGDDSVTVEDEEEPVYQSLFDEFGELEPEHELHNLGNDYYKADRFSEAIECYSAVLDANADLIETYFNRSLAYVRIGQYPQARQDLHRVIDINPNLAEAHYTLGLVHEYTQDYEAAIGCYDESLRVDGSYEKAEVQRNIVRGKIAGQTSAQGSGRSATDSDESEMVRDFEPFIVRSETTLAEIGGNRAAKRQLQMLAAYIKGDPAFKEWGFVPPRGVLMFGPPGVGKTHLARGLAGDIDCTFYCVPVTAFLNMWYGNTERNIRNLWNEAAARPNGAIIMLDDFIEGFLHISEVSDEKIDDIRGHLKEGEDTQVRVISLIPEERKLGLSIRRVSDDEGDYSYDNATPDSATTIGELIRAKLDVSALPQVGRTAEDDWDAAAKEAAVADEAPVAEEIVEAAEEAPAAEVVEVAEEAVEAAEEAPVAAEEVVEAAEEAPAEEADKKGEEA